MNHTVAMTAMRRLTLSCLRSNTPNGWITPSGIGVVLMGDDVATSLGFGELEDTAAIVFREGDDLYSFVGNYGPTDERFRKVACSTLFDFDGDEIIVIGDFNGHAVFRRFDDDYGTVGMITWDRLVDECEPVADGWINMPE